MSWWVVEVCHSWLNRFRKLLVGYEKKAANYLGLLHSLLALLSSGVNLSRFIRDLFPDKILYRELVSEIRWRIVPERPNGEVARKKYLKKPYFHHHHQSNC
jgi:hypothetical protein